MNRWYVVNTKPKKEEETQSHLVLKGLEVFNPLFEFQVFRKGKLYPVLKPLFPNYIFVRFDLYRDYSLVRWARGVKKIVGFGEYPTPVSDEILEILQKRVDKKGIVRQAYPFQMKDLVKIKAGPFKDILGIFKDWVSDGERVRILLDLIAYQPTVEVHYSAIEKMR